MEEQAVNLCDSKGTITHREFTGCVDLTGGVASTTFTVTFNPPLDNCDNYIWDFGDGQVSPPQHVPTIDHDYHTAGTFIVKVSVTCQDGCLALAGLEVEVPACCPKVIAVTQTPDGENGCADPVREKKGRINFSAVMDPPVPVPEGTWSWTFGDLPVQTFVFTGPNASHEYEEPDVHMSVVVTYVPKPGVYPPQCEESKAGTIVVVKKCPDPGEEEGKPCAWWDITCWQDWCQALLGISLAAIIASGFLTIIAACTVLTAAVLAGPAGAIPGIIAASLLFKIAGGIFLGGLLGLIAWLVWCGEIPGLDFCESLDAIIKAIADAMVVQALFALAMSLFGGVGCLIGLGMAVAALGSVLAGLVVIKQFKCD